MIRNGFLSALLLWSLTLGATQAQLRPGLVETLPSAGIKIRVFKGFTPSPLQFPAIYGIRNSDQAKVFSTIKLWQHRVTVGTWSGGDSQMRLASLSIPTPAKNRPEYQYLTESEADQYFSSLQLPTVWSDEARLAWAGSYAELPATALKPPWRSQTNRVMIQEIEFSGNSTTFAFFIWAENNDKRQYMLLATAGKSQNPEQFYQTLRQLVATVEFQRPDSTATVRRLNHSEIPGTQSLQASRDRVIRNIRDLSGWWYLESPNYIFVSNQTDRRGMERIRREIERARGIFSNWFPPQTEITEASVVRIFNTRGEYLRYVGNDMAWSGGIWSSAQRELVISPMSGDASENQQRAVITQVAFHEGFHQYLYYASGEKEFPLWFNEGCAQFFEGIEFKGSAGQIGLYDSRHIALAKLFASKVVPDIEPMLHMDRATFYEDSGRERNYLLASALVYYLLKGAPVCGQKQYADIIQKYYITYSESGNASVAFKVAFEHVDIKKLAQSLAEFWKDDRLVRKSIRNNALPRK